jgi:hypothetical protein
MSKFTSALSVISGGIDGYDLHLTTCFCDADKAGKFSTSNGSGKAVVIDVEYWERVDLTVLTVDCDFAVDRHEYFNSLGYAYDYEFIPHITIGKGDLTKGFKFMKGEVMILGNEYARIY